MCEQERVPTARSLVSPEIAAANEAYVQSLNLLPLTKAEVDAVRGIFEKSRERRCARYGDACARLRPQP